MQILVTGGAGFIGSHIVDYHMKKGDRVIAIDDLSSGSAENLQHWRHHPNLKFITADILQSGVIEENIHALDRIYNMGAIVGMQKVLHNPLLTLDVNIKILEKILIASKPLAKRPVIIVASSSEVYGCQNGMLGEKDPLILETTLKGHACYPVSKLCNEVMAEAYYKEAGVPIITVRIFNTIGPRQTGYYGMVVPRFVKQAVHNEPITLFGDGSQTRAFCDARDLVRILATLAETPKAYGQIINVGNEQSIHIRELANLVKSLAKSTSIISQTPISEAYNADYIEIPHRKPDLTYLNTLISFQYEWSLKQTIEDLIALEASC